MNLPSKDIGLLPIPKSLYLAILYVLFEELWGIGIINEDAGAINKVFIYIVVLFFGGILNYTFYRNFRLPKLPKGYYISIGLIFLSFGLSMIMASKYYNQSISQSLITYRFQYLMIAPIILAIIRPTAEDVITSLKIFLVIYVLVNILILSGELVVDEKSTKQSGVVGYDLIAILYFWYLCDLIKRYNSTALLMVIGLLGLILFQDNRSTIFPVVLLTLFAVITSKKRYRVVSTIVLIALLAFGLYMSWDAISDLLIQTHAELGDPKYNRNKAFTYFIYKFSPNIWCDIFGNGFLSAHSSPKMASLMDYGVYNSDMGFLGYWNQFGLLPIAIFLYYYIRAIFNKKIPSFLKLVAVTTLACGLTTSYFGMTTHMIYFIIFYYLYGLYSISNDSAYSLAEWERT